MTSLANAPLRIGDWRVDPASGVISRGERALRLESRTLRLLLRLAEQPGEVLSIDQLLDDVWSGVIVTPDSVYQAVASLRRLLEDDAKRPSYIVTVPRQGYRLVAAVSPWVDAATETPAANAGPTSRRRPRKRQYWVGAGALSLTLLAGMLAGHRFDIPEGRTPSRAQAADAVSVAVLPFRDMSSTMDQEVLVDDITEDLIDRLAVLPGVRTTPPRSSFSLKGRKLGAAEAARALGVRFVIDGSVRTSGGSAHIVARLVRARDGLVMRSMRQTAPVGNPAPALQEIARGIASAVRAESD